MASGRMFSKDVVETDNFLAMPLSSHALYFHLCMEADDEGFIGNPKKVMRSIGSNEDDYRVLRTKGYIIEVGDGIIVVTHWNMNNHIRKDRRKSTVYIQQKKKILLTNEIYTFNNLLPVNQMTTNCQPNGNQMATQISLEEISIDENSNVVVCLEDLVRKHFENVLLNSKIYALYCEAKTTNEFVEKMNKLIRLVVMQNEEKLKKCLELNSKQITKLFMDVVKADNKQYESFNNPDGWIVSRLNKTLKGE